MYSVFFIVQLLQYDIVYKITLNVFDKHLFINTFLLLLNLRWKYGEKEEYLNYLNKLMEESKNDESLKYMSEKYSKKIQRLIKILIFGFVLFIPVFVVSFFLSDISIYLFFGGIGLSIVLFLSAILSSVYH